ncbi:auxiliary protein of the heavy metal cation-transporting efflux system HmyCBA [Cupriavidus pauculus]|uniref:auxiliary protein of the heavy metal cation-transporting efflux system HmyCBA n=1 Tax=Cupriavidus pauculus TaxID=82633 RepID=UPI0038572800
MRFVLFLLTALCLSALSFQAAANARAAAPKVPVVAPAAEPDYAMLAAGDDLAELVLRGDPEEGPDDQIDDEPPPGYCNIWSADLLDPLDLFDAVDESSALIVVPQLQLAESRDNAVHVPKARTLFESEGVFRPPNLLA